MINTISFFKSFPLFSIVDSKVQDVPIQLEPIFKTQGWVLGMLLFISFLLLALAKRLEPNILGISFRSFFNLGTLESLQKFEVRFNSTGFILFGFNFVISLWVCLTLFCQHISVMEQDNWILFGYKISSLQLILGTLVIVLFTVAYNFVGLLLTMWLTGEYSTIRSFVLQTWVNTLFFGLLFFGLAVVWLLNPSGDEIFFESFKYLFLSLFGIRFLKVLIASLSNGVSWYYIILYLCTLEILPIVVLLYYVVSMGKHV
ncbi:MAG TPA: DUF4271 domain-containing protein [Taishania sp.]|nr:DUF4271 domain-containing protein [Taishania sp.]